MLIPKADPTLKKGSNRERLEWTAKKSTTLGVVLLGWLGIATIVDWWFPFVIENPAIRFWPQLFRLAFLIVLCTCTLKQFRGVLSLKIARIQVAWVIILFGRFLWGHNFDRPAVMYISYYVFWIVALWAFYSIAFEGRLTLQQVSSAGAIMALLLSTRLLLFKYAGIWVGGAGGTFVTEDLFLGAGYGLLWFVLMQVVKPKGYLNGAIAVIGAITVILTLERGAAVSVALGLLVFLIVHAKQNPESRRRGLAWLALSVLAIGLTAWATAGPMMERWSDVADPGTAGSGRLLFWAIIAQGWLDAHPWQQLVGFGARAVYDLTGELWFADVSAHNDFLEQLYCFGALGAFAYVALCWALFRSSVAANRLRFEGAGAFCAATAVFLFSSLLNPVSSATQTVWFSAIVGTVLGAAARDMQVDSQWHRAHSVQERPISAGHAQAVEGPTGGENLKLMNYVWR